MSRVGFDCGTYTLVCAKRDKEKNFDYNWEVNAFIEIPLEDPFVFNMMQKAGVPLIERENVAYAIGEKAVRMAYTMSNFELKRPMKDGCINPKEKDAWQIMNIMIHSLIGNIEQDKTILYYTVPANAVNIETDAAYHSKILNAIFKAYKSEKGQIVEAYPINEALCLIYAELAEKQFTGIGVSTGAGMVNVCYAIFGAPIFSFSIVNSGDWIDKQAANATGESIAFINKEKTKIDLTKEPSSLVERAIKTQYELMIENTVLGIKKGFSGSDKKAHLDDPIDVIVAGGVSSPNGFEQLFAKVLENAKLPIKINKVIKPKDPLYSVARGALVAAENHR